MSDRDALVKLLCDFFLEEFGEDAVGVGDWLAQGGHDVDVVVPAIELLIAEHSID